MPRARIPFTEAAIKRAVRGAIACGLKPSKYEIDERGKIVVFFDTVDTSTPTSELDDELREFEARRGQG